MVVGPGISQPIGATTGTLIKQAQTAAAGTALVNGTPNILQWTAPNDGKLHAFILTVMLLVTVTEVGGVLNLSWTSGGQTLNVQVIAGGQPPSATNVSPVIGQADPNTTVTLQQTSALTSGTATAFATLLGE
jgi:hypothetical protein